MKSKEDTIDFHEKFKDMKLTSDHEAMKTEEGYIQHFLNLYDIKGKPKSDLFRVAFQHGIDYAGQSRWISVETSQIESIKQKMRDNMVNPNFIHGIQFCLGLLDGLSPFKGQKKIIWEALSTQPLRTSEIAQVTGLASKNTSAILNQMLKTGLIVFVQTGKLKSWYLPTPPTP